MKKTFKLFLSLVFTVGVAVLLGACGPEMPDNSGGGKNVEATSADDNSLVIGLSNNIDSLNPFRRTGSQSDFVQRFFYETLLDMTGPTEFEPRLGKIETDDNQTFKITLNQEASWSDGESVTTEDVAYTVNTTAHPDTLTTQATHLAVVEGTDESGKLVEGADTVSGMEVVDDYTMTLTTKTPVDLNYFSEFFGHSFFIAPEHVFSQYEPVEIHTSKVATNPEVTNGPYKFVDFQDNNYLELTKNSEYYRGEPNIDDMFFRIVPGAAMLTELQSGNVDMLAGGGIGLVPHDDIPLLEKQENLVVEGYPSVGIQYIFPNTEGRFSDPKARQALAYAVDRELAVENLLHGNGEVPAGPYTTVSAYKSDEVDPYPYDPEKAQQLFEEANFDLEEPIVLSVPTGNAVREQMGDLVQQMLESAGLTVQQETYDFTTWLSNMREGNFDIALAGMSHSHDPDVSSYFQAGGPTNLSFYSDEKMDTLLQQGLSETNYETRYPVYEELQQYFKEEMPVVPLYSEFDYKVQTKNLEGGVEEFWPATTADVHEWTFTE